jgi:choline dehydrogenase
MDCAPEMNCLATVNGVTLARCMDRWDYIVVGAGSAGCVLAHRLSADPGVRVLLLEAGPPDRSPYIHVPAAIIKAVGNPKLDWCHLAEPDPSRFGKVDLWPAGRTLGGSSSINGMLFVRGAREDFDGWAALGNAGWSYDEVLPYFRRLENSEVGEPDVRGSGGPMQVSRLRTTHPLGGVFLEAAAQCGAPLNPDYNGRVQEGASPPQVTQRNGWRWSSARAFLHSVRHRPNLRVETDAAVAELLFDGARCAGVRLLRGAGGEGDESRLRRLAPGGEVVLAAGALGSPALLMRSGIGPGAALQSLGIAPRIDRPDVGGNLQEHPNSVVCARVNVRTYNQDATPLRMALNAGRWLLTGRGPASSPYPHAVAFLRSDPSEPCPDLQFLFGPFAFSFDERGILPYSGPAVSIVVNTCRPRARGRLHLRSADPAAPPRIEHALLSDEDDLRRQIAGCRIARQLLSAPAFAPWVTGEYLPGPAVQSDAQWEEHVRRTTFLGYHPVGTCRMGIDDDAVVSPALDVRGVAGLSVADASVMPRQIAANTNAATMMIAEKASDLILARRRGLARVA